MDIAKPYQIDLNSPHEPIRQIWFKVDLSRSERNYFNFFRHVFYIGFVFIAIILITGIGFLCFKCVKKGVEY